MSEQCGDVCVLILLLLVALLLDVVVLMKVVNNDDDAGINVDAESVHVLLLLLAHLRKHTAVADVDVWRPLIAAAKGEEDPIDVTNAMSQVLCQVVQTAAPGLCE